MRLNRELVEAANSLDLVCVKAKGPMSLWAYRPTWENNQNRNAQPVMFRYGPAPYPILWEVTILLANVPMAKLSPDEFFRMSKATVNDLVLLGNSRVSRLNDDRQELVYLLRNNAALVAEPIDDTLVAA